MKYCKSLAWVGTLTLLPAGFLIAAGTNAAAIPDSEQVSKLLSETKTMAFQLKEDAAAMERFTRMNVTWESQKIAIDQIRNHLNNLGRQLAKLKEAKANASPWQKTAIDRIEPFLNELEGYTSAVIEHINRNPRHTPAEYTDYLEANADY